MEKQKAHTITINLKYLHQDGMINFNYQMVCILYNVQDYFEYVLKKHGEDIDKLSVHIYANKFENRVTLKTKNGYCLELSTLEIRKLFESTENKKLKTKAVKIYHILKLLK